jgi:hypothetical protein
MSTINRQQIPGVELSGTPVASLRVTLPNGDMVVMPWALFLKAQLLSGEEGNLGLLCFASGTIRIEAGLATLQSIMEGAAMLWLRTLRCDTQGVYSIELQEPD